MSAPPRLERFFNSGNGKLSSGFGLRLNRQAGQRATYSKPLKKLNDQPVCTVTAETFVAVGPIDLPRSGTLSQK
jgi:hypothetical protein